MNLFEAVISRRAIPQSLDTKERTMLKPSQYVGVISLWDLYFTSLKREALFFDALAIPNINEMVGEKIVLSTCPIRALEFLIDREIVIDPVEQYIGSDDYLRKIGKLEYDRRLESIEARRIKLISELQEPPSKSEKDGREGIIEAFAIAWTKSTKKMTLGLVNLVLPIQKFGAFARLLINQQDYDRRGIACDLRQNHGINAYPTATSGLVINDEFLKGKDQLIMLIVDALPEPDFNNTPWEQIIDFRNDSDMKYDRLKLRNWCNEVAKGEISGFQITEKLEYLTHTYEQHMKVHKATIATGSWETLLMIPAEMLEGLIRRKPTQIVKALFTIKHRRVQLSEAELNAPGREVAYIMKARERFKGTNNGSD